MIIGTICARGGSKRVPGKNMRIMPTLTGVPLIDYTIKCAQSYPFDKLLVSTDNKLIAVQAWTHAVESQHRPAELATDTASKWDVFRYIAKENKLQPDDILVDLDTGCPLRAPQDISACIDKMASWTDFDVVCTAYESDRNPYFNMVEANRWGDLSIVGRTLPAIVRYQDAPKVYSLSPAVFAIRVDALDRFEHWSLSKLGIVVIPRERAWDIDTPLDFEIVVYLMSRKDKR